jgi:hypothetical protein
MKYSIFIFAIMVMLGCKKSAQQSYTFAQILDSMGIVAGQPCVVSKFNGSELPNDTVVFNLTNTVTETCNGIPISYKINFSLQLAGNGSAITLTSLCDSNLSQSMNYYFSRNFQSAQGYIVYTNLYTPSSIIRFLGSTSVELIK